MMMMMVHIVDLTNFHYDSIQMKDKKEKELTNHFFILNISSKETTLFLCNSTLINTEHDHYLSLSKYQFLPMIDLKIYLLKDDHIFH